MAESFGARLRQRREDQGIALLTIAEQTKIKLSLLQALERDDVSHWPPGIFRRAYIRAYAHAIGLDPDVIVVDFLEAHPDPAEVVTTEAIASAIEGGRPNGGPPTRLRNIVDSAIDSLVRLRRGPAGEDPVHPAVPAIERDLRDLRRSPRATPEPLIPRTHTASDAPDVQAGVTDDVDPRDHPHHITDHTPHPTDRTASHSPTDTPPVGRSDQPPPGLPPSPSLRQTSRRSAVDSAEGEGLRDPNQVVPETHQPTGELPEAQPDLLVVARLCSELGRVADAQELQRLLQEVAEIFEAPGLVVWVWDPAVEGLTPALVHGYSDRVVAQLPTVSRDADNATAAAFRDGEARSIKGSGHASGALVVPLLTVDGCAGVLAIELPPGRAQSRNLTAVATILAAMLAQLVCRSRASEPDNPVDAESVTETDSISPLRESSSR